MLETKARESGRRNQISRRGRSDGVLRRRDDNPLVDDRGLARGRGPTGVARARRAGIKFKASVVEGQLVARLLADQMEGHADGDERGARAHDPKHGND